VKDIGLGILDPYTVLIVLVTLALAQVLFGYEIPLDTTNASQLFVSLVMFTGYIYAVKSILRLPVATARAFSANEDIHEGIRRITLMQMSSRKGHDFNFRGFFQRIKELLWATGWLLLQIPFFVIWLFLLIVDFSEDKLFNFNQSPRVRALSENILLQASLNFLDRASIIALTFLAVLPQFQGVITKIGVIGVVFMALVYLVKGNFSALIADWLFHPKEAKKPEETPQTIDDSESHESARAKSSKCAICGKTCTPDHSKNLPITCSLVCFQAWANHWEKDWCIGDGDERELIKDLRQNGYEDIELAEDSIEQASEIGTPKALWVLMAILRDCGGRTDTQAPEISRIKKAAKSGVAQFVKTHNRVSYGVLNECLFSDLEDIACLSADMLYEHASKDDIDDERRVEKLLESENAKIRLAAIKVLEKTNSESTLADQLGKGGTHQDEIILKSFTRMERVGDMGLKHATRHKEGWIRRKAIEYLKNEFDIEVEEPEFADEKIQCLHCGYHFHIEIPKDLDVLVHKPSMFLRLTYKRPRTQFVRCRSCGKRLVVVYHFIMNYQEKLQLQKMITEREAPYFTEKTIVRKIPN
jgi:hypothetical protein